MIVAITIILSNISLEKAGGLAVQFYRLWGKVGKMDSVPQLL
jgi:hypothetical protein